MQNNANPLRPIRNEADYQTALKEFEGYFGAGEPARGTEAADRFEVLGILLAKYEEENDPIEAPTPLEALKFRMEQSGRTQADLSELLNSRSRASEILSGKRWLTLDQVRKLHKAWGIPIASLVGEMAGV